MEDVSKNPTLQILKVSKRKDARERVSVLQGIGKGDKEGLIDYEVLEKRFPIINWESKFYHYDRHGAEGIYYRIFRSNGSSRWIKTFSEMVTRFDRLDLYLRTMFDANAEDELWQNQERWNLKSWNFYENCGVHTLTIEDGIEIYMLVERKYPLIKEILERMMSLKLIAESASDRAYDLLRFIQKLQMQKMNSGRIKKDGILRAGISMRISLQLIVAYDLLRFIQKQIDEAGSHDGEEKDL
ncbi:hypothetical protein Tco_1570298 [Tanacetum coccineum]